jgi:Big-like domain-containing protein
MAHRLRLVVATAAVVALASPAHAATGSPPVTTPDHVTVHVGDGEPVDVTDNDSDPDGDELQVCRLGELPRALAGSFVAQGDLFLVPGPRARGTYTLTYYACDTSYLTAGTVTVTVKPPLPTLDIIPVGDAPPGKIRLVNHFKHQAFHCQWGPFDPEGGEGEVEGTVTVPPLSTVVIRVHEAQVAILCAGSTAGFGAFFGVDGLRRVTQWSVS